MGYPRNWNYWEKLWLTQILARQVPFANMTATAQLFNDAGPVHVAEALARGFTSRVEEREGIRTRSRQLAAADARVDRRRRREVLLPRSVPRRRRPGNWWSFHAQEDEGFATSGIQLDRQPTGTLAGADVLYGDSEWLRKNTTYDNTYGFQGPFSGSRISTTSTGRIRRGSGPPTGR